MIASPILQPLVALAAWTMVMWLWMYAVRIPAMGRAGIDGRTKIGGTGKDLDGVLPDHVQWKAHNFNHLHESPTVFYAVVLALAVAGRGAGAAVVLAWTYVALRVAHSLVQATGNRVMVRWALFSLSCLVLVALIVLAALAVA